MGVVGKELGVGIGKDVAEIAMEIREKKPRAKVFEMRKKNGKSLWKNYLWDNAKKKERDANKVGRDKQ